MELKPFQGVFERWEGLQVDCLIYRVPRTTRIRVITITWTPFTNTSANTAQIMQYQRFPQIQS